MRVNIFRKDVTKAQVARDFFPEKRKEAKLMVVYRQTGRIEHVSFYDIANYFTEGDVFVFNNSYLLNGVFFLEGRKGEYLSLLRENEDFVWEAGFSSIRKVKQGNVFYFSQLGCYGEIIENLSARKKRISFFVDKDKSYVSDLSHDEFMKRIKKYGTIRMEKYIGRSFKSTDVENIKDIFASEFGSLVPNVAGLHFSEYLVKKMQVNGVIFATLTYHVIDESTIKLGARTLDADRIFPERCYISKDNILEINNAYSQKKRICAVGFSTASALENLFNPSVNRIVNDDILMQFSPVVPSCFKLTNAYLTNFYFPGHLSLKIDSGFCGDELLEKVYHAAIENNYKFSIYGDSLLIL